LQASDLAEQQGIESTQCDPLSRAIISAWNMADGKISIGDIDALAELVGIQDREILICGISAIRKHVRLSRESHAET